MPQNSLTRRVETQPSDQIRANSAFGVYEKGGGELTTEDLSSNFNEYRPLKQASMPEINTSHLFSPKTAEQQSERINITNKSVDWESVRQKLQLFKVTGLTKASQRSASREQYQLRMQKLRTNLSISTR